MESIALTSWHQHDWGGEGVRSLRLTLGIVEVEHWMRAVHSRSVWHTPIHGRQASSAMDALPGIRSGSEAWWLRNRLHHFQNVEEVNHSTTGSNSLTRHDAKPTGSGDHRNPDRVGPPAGPPPETPIEQTFRNSP